MRDRVAAEVGCRAVADFREVLGEVDAVSIATPTPAHHADRPRVPASAASTCWSKSRSPRLLEEARTLIGVAARTGCVLQVGHLERFNPAILALEGTLGTPRFVESHRLAPFKERGTDVNVVLDLMIHDIDLIQSLVRAPIASIDAVGTSVFSSGLDIANARIRYANGCVANTTASRVSMKMERKLRHLPGRRVRLDRPAAEGAHRSCASRPRVREPPLGQVSIEERSYDQGDALRLEIEAFLESIRDGRPPVVSGDDGLRALETALRITELVQGGGGRA